MDLRRLRSALGLDPDSTPAAVTWRVRHAVLVDAQVLWLTLLEPASGGQGADDGPRLSLVADTGVAQPVPLTTVERRQGVLGGHVDLEEAAAGGTGTRRFVVATSDPTRSLTWEADWRRSPVVTAPAEDGSHWRVGEGAELALVHEVAKPGPVLRGISTEVDDAVWLDVAAPSAVSGLRLVPAEDPGGEPVRGAAEGAGWWFTSEDLAGCPRDQAWVFEAETGDGWQPVRRRWVDVRLNREYGVALPQLSLGLVGDALVATMLYRPDRQLGVRVTDAGSAPRPSVDLS